MTDYKVGDRVRVTQTWEGTLTRVEPGSLTAIYLEDATGEPLGFALTDAFTVEVIEPEYEPGAMYVDADGAFFAYWPEDDPKGVEVWYEPGSEYGWALDSSYIERPLRKLVPEGE